MSKKIFVVEDDPLTAKQIALYIADMGFELVGRVDNGDAALEQIAGCNPDLVLMDILIQGKMDGIEVAEKLLLDSAVPVIYLTAYTDDQILARASLTEPYAYLVKPFSRHEFQATVEMALYKSEMKAKQQRIFDGMIHALTEMVRLHNPQLFEVQTRAAILAAAIAKELHLSPLEIQAVSLAAKLHGVGLTSLPPELYRKREHLEGQEKDSYQNYPEQSWQLLKEIEFSFPVAQMVRQHRERLDGSGFPNALAGDEIIYDARIVAVACMMADMPIDNESLVDEALAQLQSGNLYDPSVVAACIRLFKEMNFSFT
jgi:response regulator RpfG family c-di-GMP phosphodiesterase